MSSYKALYRKYRPQNFSEVVGQSHIVKTLKNEIALNHIFHAYLFTGPRGTGKTSIARIFAKSINCLNPVHGESCSVCELCKSITDGTNPDIIEIDAASQTRVDNIRDIIDRVPYLPTMSKYKVYIIDEVHMLSQNSFNALLKTLEEPPSHAIFILCTTEVEKVIPTIISRCQKFDFHLIDKDEIENHLKDVVEEEGLRIEDEAISLVAENAAGGMRDALSILDQVSSLSLEDTITKEDVLEVTGKLSVDSLNKLSMSIVNADATSSIDEMEHLMSLGKEAEKISTSLITYFKDILVLKNTTKTINKVGYTTEEFKAVKDALTNDKLFKYIDTLSDALKNIKLSLDKKMYLELALIKMCDNSIVVQKEEVKVVEKVAEAKPQAQTYNPNIRYDAPIFNKKEEKPEVKVEEKIEEVPKKEEVVEVKETIEEKVQESSIFNMDEEVAEVKEEKTETVDIFKELFKDNIKETKVEEKPVEVVQKEEVKIEPEIIKVTETKDDGEYDIEFVEQVLNKADKAFKESLINDLANAQREIRGTSYQKYGALLEGATIVASSREKTIVSFNEVGHCNLVMKGDNYKGIKSIFKDYLDLSLEFIALPQSLWLALSTDFISQYRSGTPMGQIKIDKIPCPGLKAVIVKETEVLDKFSGIEELFGDKLTFKK